MQTDRSVRLAFICLFIIGLNLSGSCAFAKIPAELSADNPSHISPSTSVINPPNISVNSQPDSALSLFDRSLAAFVDWGIGLTETRFTNVILKTEVPGDSLELNNLSIGEALVLNEKLTRKFADPKQFAASIRAEVKVADQAAGELTLRWHPSRSFFSLVCGFLRYRLGRAYLSPDFIRKHLPQFFKTELTHEYFELHWRKLGDLKQFEAQESVLGFLFGLVQGMQFLNPEVSEFSAQGLMSYYNNLDDNKSIFIIELQSEFAGALQCQQRIRTDYNPFTTESSTTQGQIHCNSTHLEEVH